MGFHKSIIKRMVDCHRRGSFNGLWNVRGPFQRSLYNAFFSNIHIIIIIKLDIKIYIIKIKPIERLIFLSFDLNI